MRTVTTKVNGGEVEVVIDESKVTIFRSRSATKAERRADGLDPANLSEVVDMVEVINIKFSKSKEPTITVNRDLCTY